MAENETINNDKVVGQIPSNDLWPQFGIPAFSLSEDINVDCDSSDKLAEAVLNEYGIDWVDKSNASNGGDLAYLDIKRMDAMTLLNLSLIERAAKSNVEFIEPIVNPDGEVEFRAIGTYDGLISDVYYEISTGTVIENPKALMVTAGRPLPDMKELQWYPIWGESPTTIYTAQNMFSNCRKADFLRHASIVFNDPQLTSSYADGIDNLYEINEDNPWDRIVGYVKYINPGKLATKDTAISYTNSSSIPIQIGTEDPGTDGPNMGTLIGKPTFDSNIFNPDCWVDATGTEVKFTDGVRIDIPEEFRGTTIRGVYRDKFVKVSAVYVIGRRIQTMGLSPAVDSDSVDTPTTENSKLVVSINDVDTTTIKLEAGKHYAIAYDDTGGDNQPKIPYVVFTKDVLPGDPFTYGKEQVFYVDPTCDYAKVIGVTDIDTPIEGGTIFPNNKLRGILVSDLWVTVDLETPSIVIYDPGNPDDASTGARALDIAANLEYYIAPIVIVEPPAPIAYAGPSTGGIAQLVDQVPSTDNDPTTVQNFEDRDIEIYMDEMSGGGMAVTWSFLDEESAVGMADMLYSHFQSDVVETIYTCGPDCNPILGGFGEHDGIVNAIRYNYTDSGSYTVSVTEGPKLIGNLTPVDGGPAMKMSENFSASGVVIDTVGDNIHFKLRIDGYGERWAISMTHNILRKGDVVQCTVHNNPMES